ncbi:MAG TPA: hypothetical protein DCO86_00890 [Spirochaetaceae bacterium]|nr:hypothetical protein [Spirochaetaceae bacterium]
MRKHLAIVLLLSSFASVFLSCHNGDPDYPRHDEIKYEYKIDLDGYVLSKAYGYEVNEWSVPSQWNDNLNGVKNVVEIGSNSFVSWRHLREVSIPSSVTCIREAAFEDLPKLKKVRYSGGCEIDTIESYAFRYCSAIETIEVPCKLKVIGKQTYQYCDGATSVVFMKNEANETGLEVINEAAFYGCSKLSSVTIPKSVAKIDRGVFYGCSSLKSVDFEDGSVLSIIQDNAFGKCASLTSLVIPRSVRFIGKKVLSGQKKVTVQYKGSQAEWDSIVKDEEWKGSGDSEVEVEIVFAST